MTIQIVTNIDLGDGLEIRQGKAQVKVDGQTVALTPDKQLESRIVVDRQAAITGGFEFTVDGNTMVADKVGRIKGTEWYVLGAVRKPVVGQPSEPSTPPTSQPTPPTNSDEWVDVFVDNGDEITLDIEKVKALYDGTLPSSVVIKGAADGGIVATYNGSYASGSAGMGMGDYFHTHVLPIWIDGFKDRTVTKRHISMIPW